MLLLDKEVKFESSALLYGSSETSDEETSQRTIVYIANSCRYNIAIPDPITVSFLIICC